MLNEVMESCGPVTSSVSAGMISSTVEPNMPMSQTQLADYIENKKESEGESNMRIDSDISVKSKSQSI